MRAALKIALLALPAFLVATPALADNEATSLYARTCSPMIVGGCIEDTVQTVLPNGLNVGGAYAFASGYMGGLAIVSAGFSPGAAALLNAGIYENGAIATFNYSFQVAGAPNTLVPIHVSARASTSPIHLTDRFGQVIDLVNGFSTEAPSDQWRVVTSGIVRVVPTQSTPYPNTLAPASIESSYGVYPSGGSFCRNCDGGASLMDGTLWVYSNTAIQVTLDASVLLQYYALGNGLDPMPTFGSAAVTLDPIFTIADPAYAGFSIVGVPTGQLPGGGAVPEPATWAMMVGGFGLVGAALRRRRRGSASPA